MGKIDGPQPISDINSDNSPMAYSYSPKEMYKFANDYRKSLETKSKKAKDKDDQETGWWA